MAIKQVSIHFKEFIKVIKHKFYDHSGITLIINVTVIRFLDKQKLNNTFLHNLYLKVIRI